jgi:hypothetical protein
MSWFQYLLQVNLYLILLYGFYVLFLRNNTFFRLNRIYLLSSGMVALLLPMLQFEGSRALFITEQVRETTRNISTVIASVPDIRMPVVTDNSWSLSDCLLAFYTVGIVFFAARFFLQLHTVYKARTENSDKLQAHSFFGKITVSDNIEGRKIIMAHEEVHARQWHSADVILFEIIGIVNWFNPIVYAIKKTLKYIHEFIADEAVSDRQFSKEQYSLLLLSNVFGIGTQELSNSFFNQSLLKRRIIMLHKPKSKRIALVKYTLCIPLLSVMLIFSSATIKLKDDPIQNISFSDLLNKDQNNQSDYYTLFLNRNPQISTLVWTKQQPGVVVYLKNGKQEVYNLKRESSIKKAEVKYGKLPSAPLPKIPHVEIGAIALNAGQMVFPRDTIYKIDDVRILPSFPGGHQAWRTFLEGYTYPAEAIKHETSGKLLVGFSVETDGSMKDIWLVNNLGDGTGEEAIRILKKSPKWMPASHNGVPVRVSYTQTIILTLD